MEFFGSETLISITFFRADAYSSGGRPIFYGSLQGWKQFKGLNNKRSSQQVWMEYPTVSTRGCQSRAPKEAGGHAPPEMFEISEP